MRIALIEPEIPQNTGNIARTCAALNVSLDLVEPLGFKIDDRTVRRAGLDYWHLVQVSVHADYGSFLSSIAGSQLVLFTSKASTPYTTVSYSEDAVLVFGSETKGLSDGVLATEGATLARIPTIAEARCLNLSNAVAVAAYEAMRQQQFPGLETKRSL